MRPQRPVRDGTSRAPGFVAVLALVLVCILTATACSRQTPLVPLVAHPPQIDGETAGYPGPAVKVAGADVLLAHDGTNVFVHLTAQADGWLSIGFNRTGRGMDGANLILGALGAGGVASFSNELGRGTTHSPLTTQPEYEAVMITRDGKLVLELAYPMQFPAQGGLGLAALRPGEDFDLLVAYHRSSAAYAQHTARGTARMMIAP